MNHVLNDVERLAIEGRTGVSYTCWIYVKRHKTIYKSHVTHTHLHFYIQKFREREAAKKFLS